MKTHWKKTRNPELFGAWTIQDGEHTELTVTIDKVEQGQITTERGTESASLLRIVGHKPLVLNATNSKSIAKALGSPFIEDWTGKKITLYVKQVKAFGEWVDAVRVREQAPKDTREVLTESHKSYQAVKDAIKSGAYTLEQVETKYKLSDEIRKSIQN